MKKILLYVFFVFCLIATATVHVFAAAPDGAGPWADEVVTSSQANTKGGTPVSTVNPARSDPTSTLGVAEDNITDGTFFSLGFGGSVTLRFDNGVNGGVIVVEATNTGYPSESASIEVSSDGSTWTGIGSVTQDGTVDMPAATCVNYVRITDTSNAADFAEDTADGYDVDGVQAVDGTACTPAATPTPTPGPTDNPGNNNGGGNNNNGGSNNSGSAPQCTDGKPGTPTLLSVTRTSPGTAQITWSAVTGATHYTIEYGTNPNDFPYGVPNTGNTTTYQIGGLASGVTYYFRVRAVNGCMPGDPSGSQGQVLGASTSSGQVLGASTLAATGSVNIAQRVFASIATAGIIAALAYFVRRHATT